MAAAQKVADWQIAAILNIGQRAKHPLFVTNVDDTRYFPQREVVLKNITHPYIGTSYNAISFILRTSLFDPYHALHMTDLYLSGKI